MKNPPSLRGLLWYPATLAIWLAVSSAALVSSDTKTAIVGIIALAIIASFSLIIQSTALVSLVCGIVLLGFGYYRNNIYGFQSTSLYAMLTFSAAALGTAIIARQTRKQIVLSSRQVERDRLLIDELRINDTKTGLMRFHYARRTLTTEISRSLRFGKSLSLLVIRLAQWDELAEEIGLEARENLLAAVSEVLFGSFRNVDTLFINIDKIGIILPETTEEGANSVAQRVIDQVFKKTKVKLFIGIACFPNDSITEEELLRKGELALQSATQLGREVYSYRQIYLAHQDKSDAVSGTTSNENFSDLSLAFNEDDQKKKALEGEIIVRFKEIRRLTEIEPIQRSLNGIGEFESIRLVDFREGELIFAIKTTASDITTLLISRLQLPENSVTRVDDTVVVLFAEPKSSSS